MNTVFNVYQSLYEVSLGKNVFSGDYPGSDLCHSIINQLKEKMKTFNFGNNDAVLSATCTGVDGCGCSARLVFGISVIDVEA